MTVIDATVLADFLAGNDDLKEAASALAREDSEWITTSLWRYELGNVLWKKVRFEKVEPENLKRCLIAAESLLVETIEILDTSAIFKLACDKGLAFYDASYVWLALSRDLKLRTRDAQILREYPDVAVSMPRTGMQ